MYLAFPMTFINAGASPLFDSKGYCMCLWSYFSRTCGYRKVK